MSALGRRRIVLVTDSTSYRFTCLVESVIEFDGAIPASNGNQLIVRVHHDAVERTSMYR